MKTENKCGVCNIGIPVHHVALHGLEEDGGITSYHLGCQSKAHKEPCSDCGQHRLLCDECGGARKSETETKVAEIINFYIDNEEIAEEIADKILRYLKID